LCRCACPAADLPTAVKKKSPPLVFLFCAIQVLLFSCISTPARPAAPTPFLTSTPSLPIHTPSDLGFTPWFLIRGESKTDQAWGVDTDRDGNIYLASFQQAEHELFADMVIYKFSPDGVELWQTRWGGKYMEKAFIVTVSEPYAYIGGLTYTSAVNLMEADMAVVALNTEDGSLVWDFTWGQGYGYEEVDGLVVDGDSIFLSGWTTGETTGNDLAILKLDREGNLLWETAWGGAGWDQADGQMVVDDSSIYVCGRYNGANILLGGQGLLARFSKTSGEFLSHAVWGGPLGTDALGMTGDGAYLYTVGLTVDRGNGGQIFLRKWDKELNLIWERLWGGKGSEEARAIEIGPSGDIFIVGASDSYGNGGSKDIVLLRYTRDGTLVWDRTIGGPQNEAAHGIALFQDRIYIAGNTQSTGRGQDDAILIAADAESGEFPPFP
jgi:hypothetical protein